MLKKSSALTLLFLFLFSVYTAAAVSLDDDKISVNIPGNYTYIENTDAGIAENLDFIETLGYSDESFRSYLDSANILAFAATADNTKQVQIKSWTTDFSQQIGNLALFSDDEDSLTKASESLAAEGENETLVSLSRVSRSDGTLFVKIQKLVSTSEPFSYLQYVTIVDGKYYSLVYYNFGGEFTEDQLTEADTIFNSLSIDLDSDITFDSGNSTLNIGIVWAAIAVIAIFSVVLIISLIKDLCSRGKHRRNTIKNTIKRRDFHIKH